MRGDADDALDLTQEAFISAFAALYRYDASRAFRPWMLRIVLNKCRDWSRGRAVPRLLLFAAPVDKARTIPDPAGDPKTQAGDARELERVWTAIAKLPVSLKEPLILTAIEGLPQADAAAMFWPLRKGHRSARLSSPTDVFRSSAAGPPRLLLILTQCQSPISSLRGEGWPRPTRIACTLNT